MKRKRALLWSNPPRNSRLETHSDGPGADRNWPAPGLGGCRATIASSTGVDLLIPQKPTPSHAAMGAGLAAAFPLGTEYKRAAVAISPPFGPLPQTEAAAAPWRGARPFVGTPGASRLFVHG